MSAALVVVIVIVVALAVAVIALIVSRLVAAQRVAPPPPPAQAPGYRHSPETVRYYGQAAPAPEAGPRPAEKPADRDPRHAPLPRCPACGTATAYGDEKCRKCGRDLRQA